MQPTAAQNLESFFTKAAAYGQRYPGVAKAFMELSGEVMQDGALDAKHKELIAVGIAAAIRCMPCITAHVQAALTHGATREELLEAASVAIVMGGGPGFAHALEVMQAVDDLTGAAQ